MKCSICSIKDAQLKAEVENLILDNNGFLSDENKNKLRGRFPDSVQDIDSINDNDCNIHWNFHMSIARQTEENLKSIAKDVDRDEATILYEVLNEQAATLKGMSKKVNTKISRDEIISTNDSQFYLQIAESIRLTVREIRELNSSINGSKSSALEGLKALACALKPEEDRKFMGDQTTDKFDY